MESTVISFDEVAPGVTETREHVEQTMRTYPWLVAERGDAVVGYVYACQHRVRAGYRWSVDVSVYIHESARGAGVGRMLYGALFRILGAQGYRQAFAGIALPNDASVGLHTAIGFRLIGVYHDVGFKLGAWRDVAWYERAIESAGGPPDEPIPLPQLAASVATAALHA